MDTVEELTDKEEDQIENCLKRQQEKVETKKRKKAEQDGEEK